MNRLMPNFPQRYAISEGVPKNANDKLAGKRKAAELGDNAIKEVKYKREYPMNPMPFLTKNGQLNLGTPHRKWN